MNSFVECSLEAALRDLSRYPGIVIGPDATAQPGAVRDAVARGIRAAGLEVKSMVELQESGYRHVLEALKQQHPEKSSQLDIEVRRSLQHLDPTPDLNHLAKINWSACISLSEDLLFESAVRTRLDAIPGSISTTIIDGPSISPPERTLPIYKLLGNLSNSDAHHSLVLSEADFLMRQQAWQGLLRTFPDFLKDAPLFITGTGSAIPTTRQVLSLLATMPRPNVSRLLILKSDSILQDATINQLCRIWPVAVVDCTLRELAVAIGETAPQKKKSTATNVQLADLGRVGRILSQFQHLVNIVPDESDHVIEGGLHQKTLVDALFRPTVIDWDPFFAQLPLKRSVESEIVDDALSLLGEAAAGRARSLLVRGEAGVGKTTSLKMAAIQLAKQGVVTLWFKRAPSGNWIRHLRSLASKLSELVREFKNEDYRFVVFCDDPWSLRIDALELASAFERFPGKLVIAFAARTSDCFTADGSMFSLGGRPDREIVVDYSLNDDEIADLPEMLCRIGASRSKDEATTIVNRIPSRNAADILCSLWYLVPETRQQFEASLGDEYCRLGEVDEAISAVAHNVSTTSSSAKRAYEFVTVTSNLDIGLPMEVLVRALGVNYDEWIAIVSDGKPLWGLLYGQEDDDRGTVLYRTRNEVVTSVLLKLVNGGVGHAGEARVLKELVSACGANSAIYRGFLLDVLVRARSKLENSLKFGDGLELYELATAALGSRDRVLEHHKGIWIQHVGRNYGRAYEQFEIALQCQTYPGDREAPQEHIHTSMAAAVVQMVKDGVQDRTTGLALVQEHVKQAASSSFFNAFTAHVSANLFFELMQQSEDKHDDVWIASTLEALKEIERALQQIGAQGKSQTRFEKSMSLLIDLQRRILGSIPNSSDLEEIADALFDQTKSQMGYEVLVRASIATANESGKGKAYNDAYQILRKVCLKLDSKNEEIGIGLIAARVDLLLRWQVHRPGTIVDWPQLLADLKNLTSDQARTGDALTQFYFAAALFQTGAITDANATFAQIRRLQAFVVNPYEARCYYTDAEGNARRFQGTMKYQGKRSYVVLPELGTTVPWSGPTPGGAGSTAHCYLGFALNGPLATEDLAQAQDLFLP